jgi:hypothetical protein
LRYKEGATIYTSKSPTPSNRSSTPATQSQLFQSYANLYKSMGGGWVADAETLAAKH